MGLFKRIMVDKQEQPVTTKQQIATPLSQRDPIEKLNLMEYSFNALTHAGVQTVGELLKLVESGELRAIHGLRSTSILEIEVKLAQLEIVDNSEVEANTNAPPDQNDVPLSREDSTKKIRLTRHALNLLKQTDIRTVGELLQWVESGKPHTTPALGQKSISEIKGRLAQAKTFDDSETEGNANTTPDQNDVSLSQEDSAEEPSLTEHTDLRTVGEAAQLVKSGRLATIPALGTKSILEIDNKMAQVEILDDSEVEKAADPHAEEHSTISDESQSENNMGIQPGFQSNSEEDSTAPGEDEADAKPIETKPQSDSQTDAALRKTWVEIFKITERLAQVKNLQNTLFLREDPIEKMNLSEHSFNALRRVGIRTVGEVLHLIESIRLKTIRELGAKCILEIMEILTQVKFLMIPRFAGCHQACGMGWWSKFSMILRLKSKEEKMKFRGGLSDGNHN